MSNSVEIAIEESRQGGKPMATAEFALETMQSVFGYEVEASSIRDLDSYNDRNFYLKARLPLGEWQELVFKVHNLTESQNEPFVEAQHLALLRLSQLLVEGDSGITVPQPVPALNGNYLVVAKCPCANGTVQPLLVRVLLWIPGKLLSDIPSPSPAFLEQAGAFLGAHDAVLSKFQHAALRRSHLWDLRSLPLLTEFLPIAEATVGAQAELLRSVVTMFETQVTPLLNAGTLRTATIHGDANDHNIVVLPSDNTEAQPQFAILDYGDMLETALLFNFAVAACYFLLDKPADAILPSLVAFLKGYHQKLPLTTEEVGLIYTCICARMTQSLTLGLYTHSKDPTNEYLLITQKPGWFLLKFLLGQSGPEVSALLQGAIGPQAS